MFIAQKIFCNQGKYLIIEIIANIFENELILLILIKNLVSYQILVF